MNPSTHAATTPIVAAQIRAESNDGVFVIDGLTETQATDVASYFRRTMRMVTTDAGLTNGST